MILWGTFSIRCSECGRRHVINAEDLDVDVFSNGEFNMGPRIQHEFAGQFECLRCGREMKVRLSGFEYPVGAFEYRTSESVGCEIIDTPHMDIGVGLPTSVISIYEQILWSPYEIYNLEPREFEKLVAEVYKKNGYETVVTQQTHDGGIDIKATCEIGGILYNTIFECKKYAPQNPIGASIIRELYGVLSRDCIDKGVIVTTSYFTRDAIKEAEKLNGRIQLVDFKELQRQMKNQSGFAIDNSLG